MPRVRPNAQYNVAGAGSAAVRVAVWQRRRMYGRFLQQAEVRDTDVILDIGATSDRSYAASNYLEAWYPHKDRVTALGIDDASFLEREYPGVRFVRGNGMALPFADRAFDVVHSSAVLEHLGAGHNQLRFLRECTRVARRAIFITTPNRWFPVEFHTVLPLIHWLPKRAFRWVMNRTGREFFGDERNLNLLAASELRRVVARIDDFSFSLSSVALCGWPSNLLLTGRRMFA